MKQEDTMAYKDTPQGKHDAENRVQLTLQLSKKNDADILDALEGKARQTEIKRLVRIGLNYEPCEKTKN